MLHVTSELQMIAYIYHAYQSSCLKERCSPRHSVKQLMAAELMTAPVLAQVLNASQVGYPFKVHCTLPQVTNPAKDFCL